MDVGERLLNCHLSQSEPMASHAERVTKRIKAVQVLPQHHREINQRFLEIGNVADVEHRLPHFHSLHAIHQTLNAWIASRKVGHNFKQ